LLLKFRTDLTASVAQTIADRGRFAEALAEVPLIDAVFPSGGNFLLVRLAPKDPSLGREIRRQLLVSSSIELKDVSAKFADGRSYLRLAVKLPHENARLVEALSHLGRQQVSPQ
jgi:histidinol-phosphate/aromatic aminotransferase/cobyric acid decarboxylase-like protein